MSIQAIEGSQVTSGDDLALHNLCNVLRDLVHKSPHVYHDEVDLLKARAAIDAYEESRYGKLKLAEEITRFTDRAGHEDVTARVPAPVGAQVPAESIDYDKLAAALAARGLALPVGRPAPGGPAITGEVISSAQQGGGVSL